MARAIYFNVDQYPAWHGKSKSEQRAVVLAALRHHDRWINRRILLAICSLLGLAGAAMQLRQRYSFGVWSDWVLLVLCAMLFYAYVLWEINGPVLRAVERYLRDTN